MKPAIIIKPGLELKVLATRTSQRMHTLASVLRATANSNRPWWQGFLGEGLGFSFSSSWKSLPMGDPSPSVSTMMILLGDSRRQNLSTDAWHVASASHAAHLQNGSTMFDSNNWACGIRKLPLPGALTIWISYEAAYGGNLREIFNWNGAKFYERWNRCRKIILMIPLGFSFKNYYPKSIFRSNTQATWVGKTYATYTYACTHTNAIRKGAWNLLYINGKPPKTTIEPSSWLSPTP